MVRKIDTRGTFEKVTSGDVSAFDSEDGLNVVSTAAQFAGPVGTAAGATLEGAASILRAGKDIRVFEQSFNDNDDISRLSHYNMMDAAKYSPAVERALAEIEGRPIRVTGNAAAATGGAVAGAAVGNMIFPGVGGLLGLVVGGASSIAGASAAGYAYDKTFGISPETAIVLTAQLRDAQKRGEAVSTEQVFAVLVANLPDADMKKIDGKIQRAVEKSGPDALKTLMNDKDINSVLSAYTGVKITEDKNVAQRYADLINNGHMDAKYLLINDPLKIEGALLREQSDPMQYSAAGDGALFVAYPPSKFSGPSRN